tara:strand:- start:57 stop:485 length:429 start_codon:yes stop_codon:yes gene_type:complete
MRVNQIATDKHHDTRPCFHQSLLFWQTLCIPKLWVLKFLPKRKSNHTYRILVLLVLALRIPKRGSKERGRREATGMGTASKIHQSAVHKAMPRVMEAGISSPPKLLLPKPARRAMIGPSQSTRLRENVVGLFAPGFKASTIS